MSKPAIVVALRDVDNVDNLMRFACTTAKSMNAEVTAVHVVEVAPCLPLDTDAETLDHPTQAGKEILSRAHRVAVRDFAKEIETRLVRAREAGEAIVGEVEDQAADLLILGYHRNGRISRNLFGSTIEYVARHAPCRVLVEILPSTAKGCDRPGLGSDRSRL